MKAKVVLCDVCKQPIHPDLIYFTVTLRPNNIEKPALKGDVCERCQGSVDIADLYEKLGEVPF